MPRWRYVYAPNISLPLSCAHASIGNMCWKIRIFEHWGSKRGASGRALILDVVVSASFTQTKIAKKKPRWHHISAPNISVPLSCVPACIGHMCPKIRIFEHWVAKLEHFLATFCRLTQFCIPLKSGLAEFLFLTHHPCCIFLESGVSQLSNDTKHGCVTSIQFEQGAITFGGEVPELA